jgi:Uma2 family endonuclease
MSTTVDPKMRELGSSPLTEPDRFVLHHIPWALYVALRNADNRRHVRMSYLDGTLELMSPKFRHERVGDRLTRLLRAVVEELDIPCAGAGSTTFQLPGEGEKKGAAKEPDTCFYIANERLIRDNDDIDLPVDPPPDLAIEVDNTTDSARKLPIYAALGVPEVWRYDVRTRVLWFGQLQPDGTYVEVARSVSLPMLTPALVQEGLDLCQGVSESRWGRMLRDWVRERLS